MIIVLFIVGYILLLSLLGYVIYKISYRAAERRDKRWADETVAWLRSMKSPHDPSHNQRS